MKRLAAIAIFVLAGAAILRAQVISGVVRTADGPVDEAEIIIDAQSYFSGRDGSFFIEGLQPGTYVLNFFKYGYATVVEEVKLEKRDIRMDVILEILGNNLDEVVVEASAEKTYGLTTLNAVDGMAIYASKKNEVVVLDDLVVNKAANNPRQIFSRVTGANIWESDCAGLQIGVASRGLSPNRNSNFNTRQNGYDISADPLGYPESYYTPALQNVERIEVVRGASSLQYGTQFGGMVNFVLKSPPKDKVVDFTTNQSYNSLGFYNSYMSLGGTYRKIGYYASNRFTKGECWRCNSDFTSNNNYFTFFYRPSRKLKIGLEYTYMNYLAHQPGGLTDAEFGDDPQQSNRERNWFEVTWNLPALTFDVRFNDRSKLNWRNYGLIGGRDALGNLQPVNRADGGGPRDFLMDNFYNFGSELRFLHRYSIGEQSSSFLVGTRFFRGLTDRQQGYGSSGSGPEFGFEEGSVISAYRFPNINWALFAENVFQVSDKWSITPGVRLEYIHTLSEGYYRTIVLDGAGNVLQDVRTDERMRNDRVIILGGVGASYKPTTDLEIYANFSQNYRAINFNDIRVINPNAAVDEDLRDERGFNADLGFRGNWKGLRFDMTAFLLYYKDKIGDVFTKVPDPVLVERAVRLRTNISDARNFGVEAFVEKDLLSWGEPRFDDRALILFMNFAYVHAKYVKSDNSAIDGNMVELVPPYVFRTGLTLELGDFSCSMQYSYTHQHFTDATNAESTPTAVDGLIPSYSVLDLSLKYDWKWFTFEAGVNNLANARYYTRRAAGYPGPGIIPADGISGYGGIAFNISKPMDNQ